MESTLLAGGKSKKDGYLGDPARGQADPGSAAVYTMDRPGPVICMYVCVGTVSYGLGPTDPLVVAYVPGSSRVRGLTLIKIRSANPNPVARFTYDLAGA